MGYFIILIGVLAIAGWVLDISLIKSINPLWVPTKFATAICFVLTGITFLCIDRIVHDNSEIAQIFLSMSVLTMIILMFTYLASKFFQIPVGIEELFINVVVTNKTTAEVLQPSMVSMFNFIIISITGIVILFKPKWFPILLTFVGGFVGLTGISATVGYLLNIPALSFSLGKISGPMAQFSAITFILIGLGTFLLGVRHIGDLTDVKNEN